FQPESFVRKLNSAPAGLDECKYTPEHAVLGPDPDAEDQSRGPIVRGSCDRSFEVRARDTSDREWGRSESRSPPKPDAIERTLRSSALAGVGASRASNAQEDGARVFACVRAGLGMGLSADRPR